MSDIIMPFSKEEENPQEKELVVNYKATQEDEENFFLMYHMNMQPSEAKALDVEYRRWLIARFMGQKESEREMMIQQRMAAQLGQSLKV